MQHTLHSLLGARSGRSGLLRPGSEKRRAERCSSWDHGDSSSLRSGHAKGHLGRELVSWVASD